MKRDAKEEAIRKTENGILMARFPNLRERLKHIAEREGITIALARRFMIIQYLGECLEYSRQIEVEGFDADDEEWARQPRTVERAEDILRRVEEENRRRRAL